MSDGCQMVAVTWRKRTRLLRLKTSQTPGLLSWCQMSSLWSTDLFGTDSNSSPAYAAQQRPSPALNSLPAWDEPWGHLSQPGEEECQKVWIQPAILVFAGTCSISIDREHFDGGWQIPVDLALYKAKQKDLLNEGFGWRIMVPQWSNHFSHSHTEGSHHHRWKQASPRPN